MNFWFSRVLAFPSFRFLVFLVAATLLITTTAFAQEVKIPDPNLREAIREELNLPDEIPITQVEMLRLQNLPAWGRDIKDLTGLQYATSLGYLDLCVNQIENLQPLEGLIHLTQLSLCGNQISDISPLANLTNLRGLNLHANRISDITPLANLAKLELLNLANNSIGDISPLANLTNLWLLHIQRNRITDITPLQGLNLTDFSYDEVCDIEPLLPPVRERIETRDFPSVFQAWDNVIEQDHLTSDQRYALHDLHWSPFFKLYWDITPTEPTYGVSTQLAGNVQRASEIRKQRLDINPNMVFLVEIRLHSHFTEEAFPPDSDLWLRDTNNEIVRAKGGNPLINFLNPKVQELLVNRIIAVHRCGLYDGIMLDGFHSNGLGFGYQHLYTANDEEIIQAWINVFRSVRSQVQNDFLILINANDTKPTRYREFVNGSFIETGKDYPGGYSRPGLMRLEDTLSWVEENLREPRINCLEAEGMSIEPPDGPNNLRWMRLFTTLSLTHSDGYVIYTTGFRDFGEPHPDHDHLWHPFWDAKLGQPVGPKAQLYQNIEGLFIREFTNGWAVYNRSGEAQTITLSRSSIGVSSDKTDTTHLLSDLNGEIYLRVGKPYDLNRDGTVNVLDLILVSQNFGTTEGDINGDGTTNILDLVLVAQYFQ